METLRSTDLVDIVLSAEVVFSAVFTLSLFIAMRAVLGYLKQSGALHTRLAQIEADLNVLHASIPGKIERIRDLRETQAPLRQQFQRIQAYQARLQHLERKAIEDEAAAQREQEEQQEKQIQRRKLGLDRFL